MDPTIAIATASFTISFSSSCEVIIISCIAFELIQNQRNTRKLGVTIKVNPSGIGVGLTFLAHAHSYCRSTGRG